MLRLSVWAKVEGVEQAEVILGVRMELMKTW